MGGEVHRTPVVRVDERVLPQLAALVDIRDAGAAQLQQLLRQRIRPGMRSQLVHQIAEARADRAVDHRVDPGVHGSLEFGVGFLPGGVLACLPNRLLREPVQPIP